MPSELPEDYFSTGYWAADGSLRLRTLTCLVCGTRVVTWAAFRAHRRRCAGGARAKSADAAADARAGEDGEDGEGGEVPLPPGLPPGLPAETLVLADAPGPEVSQG